MKLCDYGCGREAKYQFKNGKWCCSMSQNSCPEVRKKLKESHKDPNSGYNSISYRKNLSKRMKDGWNNPNNIFNSISYRENLSDGIKESHKDPNSGYNSILWKEKISKSKKLTLEEIKKRYPFFSKIEEMRYNPDKPNEKEIQVRCRNHKCENSKEKGGWFTPTGHQFDGRRRALEDKRGNDGQYLYCSQYCKDTCVLFNIQSDPYKDNNKPYTSAEKEVFNKHILKRDNEICYYCGEHATDVHHLRPEKLEPFFALDPDYAISCCEKHHYKYGHPTGSKHSTGNLAKIVCSVESQKFLNQTLEDI